MVSVPRVTVSPALKAAFMSSFIFSFRLMFIFLEVYFLFQSALGFFEVLFVVFAELFQIMTQLAQMHAHDGLVLLLALGQSLGAVL